MAAAGRQRGGAPLVASALPGTPPSCGGACAARDRHAVCCGVSGEASGRGAVSWERQAGGMAAWQGARLAGRQPAPASLRSHLPAAPLPRHCWPATAPHALTGCTPAPAAAPSLHPLPPQLPAAAGWGPPVAARAAADEAWRRVRCGRAARDRCGGVMRAAVPHTALWNCARAHTHTHTHTNTRARTHAHTRTATRFSIFSMLVSARKASRASSSRRLFCGGAVGGWEDGRAGLDCALEHSHDKQAGAAPWRHSAAGGGLSSPAAACRSAAGARARPARAAAAHAGCSRLQ